MPGVFRAARRTFEAGGAIAQDLRVVLGSGGTVTVAGAADREVGTAVRPSFASGENIAVDLASLEGTSVVVASGAIAIGASVYGAASGKVGTTDTGSPVGVALTAAAADGDRIEVLRRQL